MRILISTCNIDLIGGVEVYLRSIIPEIARMHTVAFLHERPSVSHEVLKATSANISKLICTSGKSRQEIFKSIDDWGPDCVFNQSLLDSKLERLLALRWPTVLYCHGVYGTCISSNKSWKYPVSQICNKKFELSCLQRYFPFGCGGKNPLKALKLYMFNVRRLKNTSFYQKILVASSWMRSNLIQNNVNPSKINILPLFPPGILPDKSAPVTRKFSNRLLFVGRLTESKGWNHALTAIQFAKKKLGRELKISFAGDGPDKDRISRKCSELGLQLYLHGHLERSQLTIAMRDSDLLIVPSLVAEGFCLNGIEAACVGLPSVGYTAGGITDWLIPGITGESGTTGSMNPNELGEAIFRALYNHEHWMKLRIGAWERSFCYTLEKHLTGLNQTFLDLV